MAKRKADDALAGLFGEYASDDEGSADEGQAEDPDSGVVLVQYQEQQTGPEAAVSIVIATTEEVPIQAGLRTATPADGEEMDAEPPVDSTVPTSRPDDVADLTDDLPASLCEPPLTPVDPALQETVKNYLASKRERGVTLAGALAKHRGYRNPDFLQKMVEHFDIKECGTCFAPELFNPNALPPEDYFERLAADQAETDKRRVEARKQSGQVEFVSGRGTPPGSAAGGMSAAAIVAQAKAAALGKRSKWDAAPPANKR